MEEIQFEDIKDGDRLRVYLDPGNNDLDYADGVARVMNEVIFVHVEKDYWTEGEDVDHPNLQGVDLRMTKLSWRIYKFYRIGNDKDSN